MTQQGDDFLQATAELRSIPNSVAETLAKGPVQPADDQRAEMEATQLGGLKTRRQLGKEAQEAEHDRAEKFRNHFERISVVGLYLVAAAFFLMVVIWLLHLLAPPCWRWLSADELSTLQNFVTGGIIATIAAGHLKKRLGGG